MLRILGSVLCICLLGFAPTARSQGSGQISPGKNLEVLMSRGVTANIFDLNANLHGSPRVPTEVRLSELFPIEPGKIVLAFRDNTVESKGLLRTVILTEDGIWGVAPLKSEKGRDYFIAESTLKAILDDRSDQISWGVVTKDVHVGDRKITLGRGEIVKIIGREQDQPLIRFEKKNPITGTKYDEITMQSSKMPGVMEIPTSIDSAIDKDILAHIEFSGMDSAGDYLKLDRSTSLGFKIPEVFKAWKKIIKTTTSFRITCAQQLNEESKKEIENKVKATLQASTGASFNNTLADIGFKAEATASSGAAWSDQYKLITQIQNVSNTTEGFIITTEKGPQEIVFGNASNCSTKKKYFIATVSGVSEYAIDETTLDKMVQSAGKATATQSGHINVSCFTSYSGILKFFKRDLVLDESVGRFFASQIVRIDPPDVVAFYKC